MLDGPQRGRLRVGVFLCGCAVDLRSGLEIEACVRSLTPQAPDLLFVARHDLCRALEQVAGQAARARVAGAVMATCAEQRGLRPLLQHVGVLPWAMETVHCVRMAEVPG